MLAEIFQRIPMRELARLVQASQAEPRKDADVEIDTLALRIHQAFRTFRPVAPGLRLAMENMHLGATLDLGAAFNVVTSVLTELHAGLFPKLRDILPNGEEFAAFLEDRQLPPLLACIDSLIQPVRLSFKLADLPRCSLRSSENLDTVVFAQDVTFHCVTVRFDYVGTRWSRVYQASLSRFDAPHMVFKTHAKYGFPLLHDLINVGLLGLEEGKLTEKESREITSVENEDQLCLYFTALLLSLRLHQMLVFRRFRFGEDEDFSYLAQVAYFGFLKALDLGEKGTTAFTRMAYEENYSLASVWYADMTMLEMTRLEERAVANARNSPRHPGVQIPTHLMDERVNARIEFWK